MQKTQYLRHRECHGLPVKMLTSPEAHSTLVTVGIQRRVQPWFLTGQDRPPLPDLSLWTGGFQLWLGRQRCLPQVDTGDLGLGPFNLQASCPPYRDQPLLPSEPQTLWSRGMSREERAQTHVKWSLQVAKSAAGLGLWKRCPCKRQG